MLFYQAQRNAVYSEMHEERLVEKSRLQQLTMDIATLEAAWSGKDEIFYQGQMYDVQELTLRGDTAVLKVVNDKKEQKLVAQIDKLGGKEKSKSEFMKRLMQLMTQAYVPPAEQALSFCSVAESARFSPLRTSILSHKAQVLSPPPKVG